MEFQVGEKVFDKIKHCLEQILSLKFEGYRLSMMLKKSKPTTDNGPTSKNGSYFFLKMAVITIVLCLFLEIWIIAISLFFPFNLCKK